jgi:translation initiation factor 2B subunit (eIF-2B alpha/beta/delta family)
MSKNKFDIDEELAMKLYQKTNEELGAVLEGSAVDHPQHYAGTKIEVIDYIEDKNLGFCLGNAIKYISRAGRKGSAAMDTKQKTIQDLEKAIWYIKRRIEEIEKDLCD